MNLKTLTVGEYLDALSEARAALRLNRTSHLEPETIALLLAEMDTVHKAMLLFPEDQTCEDKFKGNYLADVIETCNLFIGNPDLSVHAFRLEMDTKKNPIDLMKYLTLYVNEQKEA